MKIVSARARAKQASAQAPKNILCLAVDRLNADFLGAYGNSWVESLAFDSLAAESVLFDSFFTTSFDLETLYRAFWRGEAPDAIRDDWTDEPEELAPKSLFRILKERGYRTYVVSDVEEVALHPCVEGDYCDGRLFLGAPDADAPSETLEGTAFFKNFEQLAKFLAELEDESEFERTPWFVWAHFSGWDKNWDFPLNRREKYREDEDDPDPYDGVAPPFFPLEPKVAAKDAPKRDVALDASAPTSDDPLRALDPLDRRQSVVEAYSGGVSVFDETLEGFVQLMKETGVLSRTLLVATGVRGYSTGAPGALGASPIDGAAPFYAEEARLPLVIRLPDGSGATTRLAPICEPRDLFETLRVWPDFANELADDAFWKIEKSDVSPFAGTWSAERSAAASDEPSDDAPEEPRQDEPESLDDAPGQNLLALLADESKRLRDRVLIVAKDGRSVERAIVVDDWFLKETPNESREHDYESPTRYELFVRPDDRYCVNDVANRRVDDVERLSRALHSEHDN